MNIILNSKPVDALSIILHRSQAEMVARDWVKRLKGLLSRQLFEIVIQASIGNKIIAREGLSAMRKNVTAKCYGGDVSRKMKLLNKQVMNGYTHMSFPMISINERLAYLV